MPPSTPAPGRESGRRSSRSGHQTPRVGAHNQERRQKAKSSQTYAQYYGREAAEAAPAVVKPKHADAQAHEARAHDSGEQLQRPRLAARTKSATLVELASGAEKDPSLATQVRPQFQLQQNDAPVLAAHHRHLSDADARPGAVPDRQDEDEVAGVTGAVRQFHPFHSELSEPLPEINIVVLGAEGVGKSTFVQNAFELPSLPTSQAAERKIPVEGSVYLVRLLELPLEDIDIDDDATISWPDTIEDKMMPKVDGALALYDVKDKDSVDELPDMLNAFTKASLPAVLVSCKCDTPPSERAVDPNLIEENAKRALTNINTLQISELSPESNKRGVNILLNAIVSTASPDRPRSSSTQRRRAYSNGVRPVSPRLPSHLGHSRASSEFTNTSTLKEQRHSRHDSTITGHASGGDRLRVPREDDQMNSSFLLEESASETSRASSQSSNNNADLQVLAGANPTSVSLSENGAVFDELVDRLLAQPTSKSDLKFAAIFLALYRKFAAPGKLLEAIVERFDALERNGVPHILRTQTQLRYIGIIEQWVGRYPGDFAYPKTKRRLRVFINKLSTIRIFALAARELSVDLESVREDDDTNWAYSDQDREASLDAAHSSISSTTSTVIDDPVFSAEQQLSGSTLNDEADLVKDKENLPKFGNRMIANVEQAQRYAPVLSAAPRISLSKVQWRLLMDQPDELVAREVTRMDWVMFSAIRPRDLVRHCSLSADDKSRCRNLAYVNLGVVHFNQLANWVANYVLLRDKPKHRVLMLEKFMRIARKLREMNNYNALGALIAGVKSTSVHRLGATRELLPPHAGKDWMKLEILMSPSRSHFAYRLAWENSSTERIPYLPLHRRDLATAEEGNKTFLGDPSEGKINWKKFEIMGDVIVSIQRAQSLPYTNLGGMKGNELIKELVLDVKLVTDEDELYERSLQCEPAGGAAAGSASNKFRDFFKR